MWNIAPRYQTIPGMDLFQSGIRIYFRRIG
jgi:hypothetical protein